MQNAIFYLFTFDAGLTLRPLVNVGGVRAMVPVCYGLPEGAEMATGCRIQYMLSSDGRRKMVLFRRLCLSLCFVLFTSDVGGEVKEKRQY